MKFASIALSVVALAACSKKPVAEPARIAPTPAELVAVMSVPSIEGALSAMTEYADRVAPGTGDLIRSVLQSDDIEDIRAAYDWSGPAYVLVVAPAADTDEPSVAVVARVRDATKLEKLKAREESAVVHRHQEWAIMGGANALAKTESWVFANLVTTPPRALTASFFVRPFRERWGNDLRAKFEAAGDSDADAFVRDAVLALVEQSERVDATVELTASTVAVDVALTARAGTSLASMLAAQKPASFALLEDLPLDSPFGTMAAQLTLGTYGASIRDLISAAIAEAFGDYGPRTAAMFESLWSLSAGEYAGVTIDVTGRVVNTIRVTDAAKAYAQVDAMGVELGKFELPGGLRFQIDHSTHAGVATGLATLDAGGQKLTFGWAAWDETLALSLMDPDGAILRSTIDRTVSRTRRQRWPKRSPTRAHAATRCSSPSSRSRAMIPSSSRWVSALA